MRLLSNEIVFPLLVPAICICFKICLINCLLVLYFARTIREKKFSKNSHCAWYEHFYLCHFTVPLFIAAEGRQELATKVIFHIQNPRPH